jgi:transcriptional regulator NrdR family protein
MYCPKCASQNTTVKSTKKGLITKRYRICKDCNFDYTSSEIPNANLFMDQYLKHLQEVEVISDLQRKIASLS